MSALLHKCSFTTPVLHWYKLGPFSYLLNFVEIKPKYLIVWIDWNWLSKNCHRFDEECFVRWEECSNKKELNCKLCIVTICLIFHKSWYSIGGSIIHNCSYKTYIGYKLVVSKGISYEEVYLSQYICNKFVHQKTLIFVEFTQFFLVF